MSALYQRALPTVYRYVVLRLGQPDMVEDIVADIFLEMVKCLSEERADHEAGFYAWLLRIAQRRVARAVRQIHQAASRQITLPDLGQEDELPYAAELAATDLLSDPVALQELREAVGEMSQALEELTIEQQIVLVGRFLADQSIEELANALGKQPGAVRALQFRSLNAMAQRMGLTRKPRGKGGPT